MTLHYLRSGANATPFAAPVTVHRDQWSDIYRGTAAALIAAGLVREDQLPGRPGNGKTMMTYWPDGTRKRQGQGGASESHLGCKQVKRLLGGRFQVQAFVDEDELERRRAQAEHEHARQLDRAWIRALPASNEGAAPVDVANADHAPASLVRDLPAHEQAVIDAALSILARHAREPGAVMSAPRAVREYLRLHLAQSERERFGVLFLDAQHAMIGFDVLFEGTLTETSVYPREVIKRALQLNAAAVILAHNHPSGCAEPSVGDELMTQHLATALHCIGVPVLDHFVIGWPDVVSFAERGLIGGPARRYRLSNASAAAIDKQTTSAKSIAGDPPLS